MKWMAIIGGLVGVVVGAGLAVYLIGMFLPAEHVAERTRDIDADVTGVSERVRNVEEQSQWRRGVSRIELMDRQPDKISYTEHSGSDAIAFELVERKHGRAFESRITSTDLPFGGRWLISLEPIDGNRRTRISIREEGVVHSPPFRTLSRYVFGHTATMDAYLEDLERSFSGANNGA